MDRKEDCEEKDSNSVTYSMAFFESFLRRATLPLELSALAYFRIAMGMMSLWNCLDALLWHEEWLLDDGFLPRVETLIASRHDVLNKNAFSIYFCSGEKHIIVTLLFLQCVFTLLYIVGYKTKIAAVLTFFFDNALKCRMYGLNYGGDYLRVNCLFWSMFLPIEKRWSVDSYIKNINLDTVANKGDGVGSSIEYSKENGGLTSLTLLFQISHLYGNAGRHKSGDMWLGGTAIERVLLSKSLSKENFITKFLLTMPDFLQKMTLLTLALEIYAFLFFLVPSSTIRGNAAFIYICLHFGMWFTLETGHFQPICISLLLSTLPRGSCNVIDELLTYVLVDKMCLDKYMKYFVSNVVLVGSSNEKHTISTTAKKNNTVFASFCRRLKAAFLCFVVYTIVAIDDERSYLNKDKYSWSHYLTGKRGFMYVPEFGKRIVYALGHEQMYNLFAPNVPSHWWFEMYGIVKNVSTGEYLYYDLIRHGRLNLTFDRNYNQVFSVSLALRVKARLSRPNPASASLENHRMVKYFQRFLGRKTHGIMHDAFTRYMCNAFVLSNANDAHPESRSKKGSSQLQQRLELVGARVLMFNSHGVVQKAPPTYVPWEGLRTYGKGAFWCNKLYKNDVLSFLADVLDLEE